MILGFPRAKQGLFHTKTWGSGGYHFVSIAHSISSFLQGSIRDSVQFKLNGTIWDSLQWARIMMCAKQCLMLTYTKGYIISLGGDIKVICLKPFDDFWCKFSQLNTKKLINNSNMQDIRVIVFQHDGFFIIHVIVTHYLLD